MWLLDMVVKQSEVVGIRRVVMEGGTTCGADLDVVCRGGVSGYR